MQAATLLRFLNIDGTWGHPISAKANPSILVSVTINPVSCCWS